jgi:hypothetical protein
MGWLSEPCDARCHFHNAVRFDLGDGIDLQRLGFGSSPGAYSGVSGGKAAGDQRLFPAHRETVFVEDCVVELGGLEPGTK